WLDAQIPPITWRVRSQGGAFRQSLDLLSDRGLWRIATHLTIRPFLAVALLVVALAPVFALALTLELGIEAIAGVDTIDSVGPWALTPVLGVVLLVLALPAAALTIATLETLYRILCVITHAVLAPRTAASSPVREILAESIGDLTVQ